MLKPAEIPYLLLLFLFGAGSSIFYGRIGFMALDQSIIFDGGWRILSQQVPFRDFTSPAGFTPIFIQAVFFRIFGVSWFAYLLHAAVFNGLFCCIVYWFLRSFGGSARSSTVYGVLSGVVFYPPFGVPYMDQHAFFFSALALALAACAVNLHSRRLIGALWFCVSIALALGYLSKQIPTIFAVPVVLSILFVWGKAQVRSALVGVATGCLLVVATLWVYIERAQLSLDLLTVYYFALPAKEGPLRILLAAQSQFALLRWNMVSAYFEEAAFFACLLVLCLQRLRLTRAPLLRVSQALLAPLFASGVLLLALALRPSLFLHLPHQLHRYSHAQLLDALSVLWVAILATYLFLRVLPDPLVLDRRQIRLMALGQGLIGVCFLFSSLTRNEAANGIPLVFAGLGLFQIAFAGARSRLLRLDALLLVMALGDALHFNQQINRQRVVHGYKFTPPITGRNPGLPEAMSAISWSQPDPKYTAADLGDVVSFFRSSPGNFWLLGDASILYGLTGRPSINPSLWYHYGLSVPRPDSHEFNDYQARMIDNLERRQVRYVVLERDGSDMGTRLSDFGQINRYVERHTCNRSQRGGFLLLTLCQPWGYGGSSE